MGSFSAPRVQLPLQSFRDDLFFAVPVVVFARQEAAQLRGITCLHLLGEVVFSRLVKRSFLAVFAVSFHPVYQINPIAKTHFSNSLRYLAGAFRPCRCRLLYFFFLGCFSFSSIQPPTHLTSMPQVLPPMFALTSFQCPFLLPVCLPSNISVTCISPSL